MLGSHIHACLEAYGRGKTVYDADWSALSQDVLGVYSDQEIEWFRSEAPRRALPCLAHVPDLQSAQAVKAESPVKLALDGVEFSAYCRKDLVVVNKHGEPFLIDYKSTVGDRRARNPWAYCLRQEDLQRNIQAVVYGIDTFRDLGLDPGRPLTARWIYALTDTDYAPQSTEVTTRLWDGSLRFEWCDAWSALAKRLVRLTEDALAGRVFSLDDFDLPAKLLPDPDSPCARYGGCQWHTKKGGPCTGGARSLGHMIAASAAEGNGTAMIITRTPSGLAARAAMAQAQRASAPEPFQEEQEDYEPPAAPGAAPAKRRPGRPPKNAAPVAEPSQEDYEPPAQPVAPPAKRGPGRPPKEVVVEPEPEPERDTVPAPAGPLQSESLALLGLIDAACVLKAAGISVSMTITV